MLDTNYYIPGTQFGVSANTKNIELGGNINQFMIYDIGLVNQALSYNYVARFTLNAWDVAETDQVNPYGYDVDSTINTNQFLKRIILSPELLFLIDSSIYASLSNERPLATISSRNPSP